LTQVSQATSLQKEQLLELTYPENDEALANVFIVGSILNK